MLIRSRFSFFVSSRTRVLRAGMSRWRKKTTRRPSPILPPNTDPAAEHVAGLVMREIGCPDNP